MTAEGGMKPTLLSQYILLYFLYFILTAQFKCLFWHEPRDRGGYNDKGVADIYISYVWIKFCSFQIQVVGIET